MNIIIEIKADQCVFSQKWQDVGADDHSIVAGVCNITSILFLLFSKALLLFHCSMDHAFTILLTISQPCSDRFTAGFKVMVFLEKLKDISSIHKRSHLSKS